MKLNLFNQKARNCTPRHQPKRSSFTGHRLITIYEHHHLMFRKTFPRRFYSFHEMTPGSIISRTCQAMGLLLILLGGASSLANTSDPCTPAAVVHRTGEVVHLPPHIITLLQRETIELEISQFNAAHRTTTLAKFKRRFRPHRGVDWKNLSSPYRNSFEGMIEFLTSPEKTYQQMEAFHADVWRLARTQKISPIEAVEKVLTDAEMRAQFKPTINMGVRHYEAHEFQIELVKQGHLFRDMALHHTIHGSQSHRIQWHLLMRDIAANPGRYRLPDGHIPTPTELYRAVDTHFFDISPAGSPHENLWDALFDSTTDHFGNPNMIWKMWEEFPHLGNWQ